MLAGPRRVGTRGDRAISTAELVAQLRTLDVRLRAAGDRLIVNAPKGVLSESLCATLALCKADLLRLLAGGDARGVNSAAEIVLRTGTGPAPLSFAQERLWFLAQLEPDSTVYNICRASRLRGNLNRDALRASLHELVRRHEVLHSAIRLIEGQPMQARLASWDADLVVSDLRMLIAPELNEELNRAIRKESYQPFDFEAGKFLRARLLQLAEEDHVLILTTHHIVSDAWSMDILNRELWAFYDAFARCQISELPEPPVQYADYAIWQRRWYESEGFSVELDYWKRQLARLPNLDLPTDRPRPARQSFRGGRVPLVLSEALTAAIHQVSDDSHATPFMTLLAAFYVLLYRYTGQDDLVVGTPAANRLNRNLESLIGFFVNTLVLRCDLSGQPSFKECLGRVRDRCLDAYAHQDLPFEKLVEALKPERDLSRNPLFQVQFVLQTNPQTTPQIAGLERSRVDVESVSAKFDLTLALVERDCRYQGSIEYCSDLFDRSTVEGLAQHFDHLLHAIVRNPELSISALPLFPESERQRLIYQCNDTAAVYPKDKCIHQLFEEQVERTPEAVAVEFEGRRLTYRELNCRANRLAHYLIGRGVGPEKRVGLCVQRSIDMVVGLLGVLKAGAAYVPLDPAYPRERLRFMLEDSACSALVTQQSIVANIGLKSDVGPPRITIDDPRLSIMCLDSDRAVICRQRDNTSKSGVESRNLAYLIYTSGSSGKPKGVLVEHRSVCNCLHAIAKEIQISYRDVWLAVTTLSFDIALLELTLPLISGARVVVASQAEVIDSTALSARMESAGATIMQATPVTWWGLIDAGWTPKPELRMLCGGEPLRSRLAERLLPGGGALWNLYGPTETTIWSTLQRVESSQAPICIGRPIANTQVHILDANLQVVPPGARGELYIGGDGVSRGYWHGDELTAERFIADLFGDDVTKRLYKTGDRGRYRADGAIEFLGRADDQVKIRGQRVELGEVEAALQQHPGIKACAVMACAESASATCRQPGIKNSQTLVAYLVPAKEKLQAAELRDFLHRTLPWHMIPSRFVCLSELPLSPGGKVNRKALSTAAAADLSDVPAAHSRSEIEEITGGVWCEVLGVDTVGGDTNFFVLGGHSLLATQMLAKLTATLGCEIPLQVLFEAPTVASLSRAIENVLGAGAVERFPALTSVDRDQEPPLLFNQEHLWRVERMIPGTPFFNMPYVFRLSGTLDPTALRSAVTDLSRRHEALRTVFVEHNGRPQQWVRAPEEVNLPCVDLRGQSAPAMTSALADLVMGERNQGFDIANGPLARWKLLRLGETEYFLLLTLHHIIADQQSIHILRSELAKVYTAFSTGKPSPLTPALQAADYAYWESRWLNSEAGQAQLSYWRQHLLRECALANRSASDYSVVGKRLALNVDARLFAEVEQMAGRLRGTPFLMCLTAIAALTHCCTGQPELRIGVLVSTRGQAGSEGIVGPLTNTIVVCLDVLPTMTLVQLFEAVRKRFLADFARRQLPFEYLAQTLEREGQPRRLLFDTLVIYRKAAAGGSPMAGLTIAPADFGNQLTAKDATLAAIDVTFELTQQSTLLTGAINYRVSSIGTRQAQARCRKFKEMLGRIVTSPDMSVGEVIRSIN